MAETVKAEFSMVLSHTAVADATEGDMGRRHMDKCIVDAADAERDCIKQQVLRLLLF